MRRPDPAENPKAMLEKFCTWLAGSMTRGELHAARWFFIGWLAAISFAFTLVLWSELCP